MNEMTYHGTYAYKTDIGRVRKANEDQALVMMNSYGEIFLVVCDGMGGANKGDVASQMAIDGLAAAFKMKKKGSNFSDRLWITRVARLINKKIYNYADKLRSKDKTMDKRGMGSTMCAVLISGNRMLVANIGDSRAYLLQNGKLKKLTEDQTYVNYLIRTGKIDEKASFSHPDRHVLMNALGIFPSLSVTLSDRDYHGETVLVCSDGLYNNLSEVEIANIIMSDERSDQKVISLIQTANFNGGSDNIGIALWECIGND